jgi:hypothetical protein
MNFVLAILVGGLVAGALDITYAIIAYGLVGVPPIRIWQSIASGVLGREAMNGGLETAVLGGALHFAMTTMMAGALVIAGRFVPLLLRAPYISGALYGLALYAIMNYVVVPLSNSPGKPPEGWFLLGGLLIHMFGVGVPIALITRYLTAASPSRASSLGNKSAYGWLGW